MNANVKNAWNKIDHLEKNIIIIIIIIIIINVYTGIKMKYIFVFVRQTPLWLGSKLFFAIKKSVARKCERLLKPV